MAAALTTTTTRPAVRAIHAALAVVGFATIAWNFANTLDLPHPRILNFFSFFTIESNLFAAAVWLWVAARPQPTERQDRLRGAATLFMLITGIVYAVLLSGKPSSTPAWINDVEHRVLPLAILADWLVVPPARPVTRGAALWWLTVPLAFFAYSLIRGPINDWYPYPFMDPTVHSYPAVFLTAAILAVLMAGLALALAWLGTWRGRGSRPA